MDEAAPNLEPGALVDGRYRIVAQLGQGGMGAVYKAEQISLKREVALKVLHAALVDSGENVARFEREAVALSRLDHPNVVRVIDFGRSDGRMYLAMELVAGKDLSTELFRGPLAPERAVKVLGQLCDALGAAHKEGIIHRDLKPENVILTDDGTAKVLDFGIALTPDPNARVTQAGFVLGTPEYIAPEQAMGQPLDPRSDLYSLGVIAYRLLCGKLPFTAKEAREYLLLHAATPAPELAEVWANGKEWPELCAAVMRALQKRPADRYATAAEMKAALEAGLQRAALPAQRPAETSLRGRAATSALSVRTQNLSVLFASMPGWAEMTARLPPAAAGAMAQRFEELVAPVVKRAGGRRIKTMGGTLLFTLPAPRSAVEAGMEMHDRLWSDRRTNPQLEPLELKVAVSQGEVTLEGDDVFGEPVNIASRVLEEAQPGEVRFTDAVYLLMNKADLAVEELGAQSLRGIPYPVRLFRAKRRDTPDGAPFAARERAATTAQAVAAAVNPQAKPGRLGLLMGGAALVLVVLTLGVGGVLWVRGATYREAEDALLRNRPDDALTALKAPLAQKPPPARALALAGRARLEQSDYEHALESLRDAAKGDAGYRPELVQACLKALAQPLTAKGACTLRRQAIALLVAFDATEARKELTALAAQRACGGPEADAALKAIQK